MKGAVVVLLLFTSLSGMAQQLATEKTIGNLEVIATFNRPMPTGVTVSKTGRIFVYFPKWGTRWTIPSLKLKTARRWRIPPQR